MRLAMKLIVHVGFLCVLAMSLAGLFSLAAPERQPPVKKTDCGIKQCDCGCRENHRCRCAEPEVAK